jgi:signal peptidase II
VQPTLKNFATRSTSFWIAAIVVVSLDQYTKHVVTTTFAPGESRIVAPHVLWLTYVQNHSGAFGLFGTRSWLLIAMALFVLGIFWVSFRDSAARSRLVRVAFGAIVGGAVGNIVDRVRLQYVVDFIDLRWWPVFNVADSCITIGVCLLVLSTLVRERSLARAEQ